MSELSFGQLSRERIRERLFRKENIVQLERVLEGDQRRWRRLSTMSGANHLGGRVGQAEATELFSVIRNEVDGILGVKGLRPPVLGGSRLFSREQAPTLANLAGGCACLGTGVMLLSGRGLRLFGRPARRVTSRSVTRRRMLARMLGLASFVPASLLLGKAMIAEVMRRRDAAYICADERIDFALGGRQVPTELLLAHEYVHHVQWLTRFAGGRDASRAGVIEGHARGVERLWAKQRSRSEQEPVYECYQIKYRLHELQRVYLTLCDRFSVPYREELLGGASVARLRAMAKDLRHQGYALFRIYELTLGTGIYRDLDQDHPVFAASKGLSVSNRCLNTFIDARNAAK